MPFPAPLMAAVESTTESGISLSDAFAGLAVLIAVTAAWITWRIHKESGGRVSIKMLPAYYRPFAGVGSLNIGLTNNLSVGNPRGAVIEMAEVTIQNAGRTGVTVTGLTLQVAQGKVRLGQAIPRTFILKGISGHETDGKTYFRIEPYDQRTFLVDYWAVVDGAFKQNPEIRDLHIFAEVTVAGHDRAQTSKKMGYWRIFRNQISSISPGTTRRPRDAFLMAMLRSNTPDLSLMDNLDSIAIKVEERIQYPVTMNDTLTTIDELLKGVEGELVRADWKDKLGEERFIPIHPVTRYLANQSKLYGEKFDLSQAEKAASRE